jgi:protein SDA1
MIAIRKDPSLYIS